MKQTVVGIFDYGVDAQLAAQELMKTGIPNNNIDIAVRGANERTENPNGQFNRPTATDTTNKDESFLALYSIAKMSQESMLK